MAIREREREMLEKERRKKDILTSFKREKNLGREIMTLRYNFITFESS